MQPVSQEGSSSPSDQTSFAVSPELTDAVYNELRRLAAYYLKSERPDHTLQPTALVHEAWIRMQAGAAGGWRNRAHFFACAAQIMRHILVDHARRHRAGKRPEGGERQDLTDVYLFSLDKCEELLAVDEALKRLAALDPRQSQIVELRFFAGLSEEEIAGVLNVSVRTVRRDWRMARAWLQSELP